MNTRNGGAGIRSVDELRAEVQRLTFALHQPELTGAERGELQAARYALAWALRRHDTTPREYHLPPAYAELLTGLAAEATPPPR